MSHNPLSLIINNESDKVQEVNLFDVRNPDYVYPSCIKIIGQANIGYQYIRNSLLSDEFEINTIRLQTKEGVYNKEHRHCIVLNRIRICGEICTRPLYITDPDSLEEPPDQLGTYDFDLRKSPLYLNKEIKITLMVLPKEQISITFFIAGSDDHKKNDLMALC